MRIVVFFLVAVFFAAVALKFFSFPWVWIFWGWCVLAVVGVALFRSRLARVLSLNAAVCFLVLAAVETALWLVPSPGITKGTRKVVQKGSVQQRYWQRDDILGYAPIPNLVATSTKYADEQLLYDVVYTIDNHGLRLCPPPREGSKGGAVLFFGCSFTFGEGVNDEETIPYQVADLSGREYSVYNFGFHGYGPHQMLAAFEFGVVDRIVTNPVRCVVYQAIGGHVRRVTGPSPWDTHGPRYKLDHEGRTVYAGRFDDPKGRFRTWLEWQIEKSSLGRRLLSGQRPITARDIRLFVGIVAKTRDIVESRYPGSTFHVIFWDENPAYERIIEALAARQVRIHRISRIIPDLSRNAGRYKIPVDDHPGPAAYREIARYVVEHILNPPGLPLAGPKLPSKP